MNTRTNIKANSGEITGYQIRLKGHLNRNWGDFFEGMTVTPKENGETVLTGRVADQAALFGILRKVRDLGLPLISVNPVGLDLVD